MIYIIVDSKIKINNPLIFLHGYIAKFLVMLCASGVCFIAWSNIVYNVFFIYATTVILARKCPKVYDVHVVYSHNHIIILCICSVAIIKLTTLIKCFDYTIKVYQPIFVLNSTYIHALLVAYSLYESTLHTCMIIIIMWTMHIIIIIVSYIATLHTIVWF